MASQAKPLKGILKKPSQSGPATDNIVTHGLEPSAEGGEQQPISAEEAKKIALQHARIIQDERRREEAVLESILTLTELPRRRGGPFTSSHPSAEDAAEFGAHVRLFQPGDYDALVEERNSLGRCGYALCPEPRRQFGGGGGAKGGGGGGTWKLNWATGDIVPKKELEKWCGTKCARRALYVKVQLNETAAWERAGIPSIRIDLLDDGGGEQAGEGPGREEGPVDKVSVDLARLKLNAELALERGESGGARGTRVPLSIKDKEVGEPMEIDPSSGYDHRAIEGYAPTRAA